MSLRSPTLAGGFLTSSTTWEALTGPSSAHHEEAPFPPSQTHLSWILLPHPLHFRVLHFSHYSPPLLQDF